MKRLDFLKQSLQWGCYRKTAWMLSAFSLIRENDDEWKKDPYLGRIVQNQFGHFFINSNQELEKIEDAVKGYEIFKMNEVIQIDPSWIVNLKEPIETLIGTLFANQILLVECFKHKIPYIKGNIGIKGIEGFIIENRTDEKVSDTKITLDEYLKLGRAVEYMKTLDSLSVYSLTEKNMVPPKGLEAFKNSLLKEYEGQLEDPVKLAEFEKRLLDFAKEQLKDDPSYGKLLAGKVLNNGYRKLFLSSGAEGGLKGSMVPVTESLWDGVPLDPKKFTASVNGARAGSYFRGIDTVKGGVSLKIAIRVLTSFSVKEGDCGTLYGLPRIYTKYTIKNLVGRKLVGSPPGKVVENISEANNYLGKLVRVRSTMYCQQEGQFYCSTCAGPRLSRFKDGLAIPATDMTSAILAASMAAMHKNTTTVAKLDYETLIFSKR